MDDDVYRPPLKRDRSGLTHRLNPWLTPEKEARSHTVKPSGMAIPPVGRAKEKFYTVTLSYDVETEELIALSNKDRQKGFYIICRTGTGKITLMVNIIAQDLRNGHGVFFLDHYGDAITELIERGSSDRLSRDLIILDPEDETHSFGINVLACPDMTNQKAYRYVSESI